MTYYKVFLAATFLLALLTACQLEPPTSDPSPYDTEAHQRRMLAAEQNSIHLHRALDSLWTSCDAPWEDSIIWTCLGPFNSDNESKMDQGRLDAISVHPARRSEIVVGAHNGGIWRTVDSGATWVNTTDDEGFSIIGAHNIVRHPADPDILYAATNTGLAAWNGGPRSNGIGVLVSADGGITWERSGYKTDFGVWMSASHALAIDPRSTLDNTMLYAASERSVFRFEGDFKAQGDWTTVYDDDTWTNGPAIYGYASVHDLEVNRFGDVFMANFNGLFVHRIEDDTFHRIETLAVPTPMQDSIQHAGVWYTGPVKQVHDIEINEADILCVLTCYYYFDEVREKAQIRWKPYYYSYSHDWGRTWKAPMATRTAGHVYPKLAVHRSNPEHIYFESSSRRVVRSLDGGRTHQRMRSRRNHVDVRDMQLYQSDPSDNTGAMDVLYMVNDGGVSLLDSHQWHDLTGDGLVISNYFGMDLWPADTPMILLGAQDGSINYLLGDEWYATAPGGDNGDCLFAGEDGQDVFQHSNGMLVVGGHEGRRFRGRRRGRGYPGVRAWPMINNPQNADEVYIGTKFILITRTQGVTMDTLHSPRYDKPINAMAMSEADTNRLFYTITGHFWDEAAAADAEHNWGGIFQATRAPDGSWTITDITSNLRTKCPQPDNCGLFEGLTGVDVDPEDANRIWISMGGYRSGQKVFYTEDGGKHWTNISECLPNVAASSVLYIPGSNDGIMLGTEFGVYYRDATMEHWVRYGDRGPQCMIPEMMYHPIEKTVYAATMGRGLWRVAAPMGR